MEGKSKVTSEDNLIKPGKFNMRTATTTDKELFQG